MTAIPTDIEIALQKQLDETPDDHTVRLILADHLDEIDDPRAVGYRALGKCRSHPWIPAAGSRYSWWDRWRFPSEIGNYHFHEHWVGELPRPWWDALKGGFPLAPDLATSKAYTLRSAADDAAALAWLKLTSKQQDAILEGAES